MENGDCEDNDPWIHPGVDDDCDGIDSDCDDVVDDDAADPDSYEPNDSSDAYIGDLDDISPVNLEAYIFPDDDLDLISWYVYDGWDDTDFDIFLDPPAGMDLAFALYWFPDDTSEGTDWIELAYEDSAGNGGRESWAANFGSEDNSGMYLVAIEANGRGSCGAAYDLSINWD